MRTFIFIVWIVLLLIALAGISIAVFFVAVATADDWWVALSAASYPFGVGTLALVGAGIMALLEMQVDQTAYLRSSVLDYVRRIETAARGRVGDVAQKEDSRGNQGSRAET